MVGIFERFTEPSVSINLENFLSSRETTGFSIRTVLHEGSKLTS